MQFNIKKFLNELQQSKTEEDVKNIYAKHFEIVYNTSDRHDLYTPQVFFEFKFDKNFKNPNQLAQILAQIFYYVRRLKFGIQIDKPIPPMLCLVDRNEAILTKTSKWKDFYTNDSYDWDLAPSTPDKKLIDKIANSSLLNNLYIYDILDKTECHIFAEEIQKHLKNQLELNFLDKKVITEDNFEDVFEFWNKLFGDSVRNGLKPSHYFLSDIQKDDMAPDPKPNMVFFREGNTNKFEAKKISTKDYDHFWNFYEKVTDINIVRAIFAKIDRLTDETMRRFHGEFFTPIHFAKKALDYITKAVEQHWWQSDKYRLWDMAAGTGNLEYSLPQEAWKYCYLSTLYEEDKEHLLRLFPDAASVFQYDYLNDDVENVFADKKGLNFEQTWKLPEKLQKDLAATNIKWIILVNPPFATASSNKADSNKAGVSNTTIRKIMHCDGMGEVSRELSSQFLYRINLEFANKETYLGLFSKLKYINANNDQKFRDKIFHYTFKNGFVFSSTNFAGTSKKNPFPVGFLVWDLSKSSKLENQQIILDIFNERVEKTGQKQIVSENRNNFLSKWIKRPPATLKFPPFSSAISVNEKNKDRRDKIVKGFLASLMCSANTLAEQNRTYLLSGPAVSAGALSITPENFERAMVIHAARRIPKATWLNDRDQFMKPNSELPSEFIYNCTVWNLFSNSNNTAALRNVKYEGETYQIHNHFFPFLINEVKQWEITEKIIASSLMSAQDTFMAKWIASRSPPPPPLSL